MELQVGRNWMLSGIRTWAWDEEKVWYGEVTLEDVFVDHSLLLFLLVCKVVHFNKWSRSSSGVEDLAVLSYKPGHKSLDRLKLVDKGHCSGVPGCNQGY